MKGLIISKQVKFIKYAPAVTSLNDLTKLIIPEIIRKVIIRENLRKVMIRKILRKVLILKILIKVTILRKVKHLLY